MQGYGPQEYADHQSEGQAEGEAQWQSEMDRIAAVGKQSIETDRWKATVTEDNEPYIYSDITGETICTIRYQEHPEKVDAKMKGISSLPDFIAAALKFIKKVETGKAKSVETYAELKSALKKAGY